MKNYQKAVRYATKLIRDYNAPYNPRDLVHDSFVQWDYYKSTNLFSEKEGTVMKCVKNMHFNNLNSKYNQKDGEKIKRDYLVINEDSLTEKEDYGSLKGNFAVYTPKELINPEDILVTKENIKDLHNNLCNFDKKVLNLKIRGYGNCEIQDILGTHNLKIAQSVKNIKKVMYTKSPFNGCKVDVVKRVKRKDFEKNKEGYMEEWEMGDLSDFNEFYVLMTSKSNPKEGLLIKEKDSD